MMFKLSKANMIRTALRRKNSIGNCPAKNSKNSELSPWPKVKRLVSLWWDIGIHKHSLNFDLPNHHLILYSLLC